IELILGDRAQGLDPKTRRLSTANGRHLHYRRLVYATGSRVRRLELPQDIAEHVHYLRTRDDADRLRPLLREGARIAVVGGGFIGLEVAATARELGAHVCVIEQAPRVLARALPEDASRSLEERHRQAGVRLLLSTRILEWQHVPSGGVRLCTTEGDLDADAVVVGIGIQPNIELAALAGVEVDDGVLVDPTGATSDPNIFGAGEVTRHPVPGTAGLARSESWQVAELQAQAAGATAAGLPSSYDAIPWFWSDQLGANLQVLGVPTTDADLVRRDYAQGAFSLFFLHQGRLIAAVSLDSGRDIAAARRLMTRGGSPNKDMLSDPAVSWQEILANATASQQTGDNHA
ncbi:MAG: NAD(P)/FAD-dependent oxidoreductase, partial [Pigmentiphaga sp.]